MPDAPSVYFKASRVMSERSANTKGSIMELFKAFFIAPTTSISLFKPIISAFMHV